MADTTQFNQQSFAGSTPPDRGRDGIQQDFAQIGSDLLDSLGGRAEEVVNEQKSRAATEIASVAAMLRNAAQNIDHGNRGAVTDYTTEIAGSIDRFADRLRTSSWRVLAGDVEEFARRWPALFMTSSAVAGFLLGRMLMLPSDAGQTGAAWTGGASAEPTSRPEDGAIGGTLSDTGAASGLGNQAGQETR